MSSPEPVSGQMTPYAQPGQTHHPGQAAQPQAMVVPGMDMGAVIGAVIMIVLGILLGIANQGASATSMNLRVPALIAALLIVGQGVVNFRRGLRAKPTVERMPAEEPARVSTEMAASKTRSVRAPVSVMPAPKPTLATMSVPVVVLVFAAWLGWADLVTAAPDSLAVLSLIASFALFALGWSLLPTRH